MQNDRRMAEAGALALLSTVRIVASLALFLIGIFFLFARIESLVTPTFIKNLWTFVGNELGNILVRR